MKRHMTYEEKALMWGMGFATKTIAENLVRLGYDSAKKVAQDLCIEITCPQHAAAFRTAFGG